MSGTRETGYALDARLARDTVFVAHWKLSEVRLLDDAQFPWLVLVPRRPGVFELDQLSAGDHSVLMQEIMRAMRALRGLTACEKLNVGALGNIVRQLHVHVVARRQDDAAWPGPVWGHGPAHHYLRSVRDKLVAALVRETSPKAPPPPRRRRRPADA